MQAACMHEPVVYNALPAFVCPILRTIPSLSCQGPIEKLWKDGIHSIILVATITAVKERSVKESKC